MQSNNTSRPRKYGKKKSKPNPMIHYYWLNHSI